MTYPKYSDFKRLACNNNLSSKEKVGFLARDNEELIVPNLALNMPRLNNRNLAVLDIGCGCSRPVKDIINLSKVNGHNLYILDSKEMLDNLRDGPYNKIAGRFENVTFKVKFDIIIVYSVLQSVYIESNIYNFIDSCVGLLKSEGELYLGDIPNSSKQNRFVKSSTGKKFIKINGLQSNLHNAISENRMDDSILVNILLRYRLQGFNSYLLPQDNRLPYSNVRDDILIQKL